MRFVVSFFRMIIEFFASRVRSAEISETEASALGAPTVVAEPAEVTPVEPEEVVEMPDIDMSWMIPVSSGHAVSKGWTSYTGKAPLGVTWHWTATWDLKTCNKILGGATALRKGEASCHYGIGRSLSEGIAQYVSLDNRSWHAGAGQEKETDGRPLRSSRYKGSRATIGIETVHIGYTRKGVPALDDYRDVATQTGQTITVAPWTPEQIAMMIDVGKRIVERWPDIGPRDHHGHHDICPGRKVDVAGFPFAAVLCGIYGEGTVPDVWTKYWSILERQRTLVKHGADIAIDGDWGRMSGAALLRFQKANGWIEDGLWDTFLCWNIFDLENRKAS